jgi:hypothetical protein
MSCSVRIERNSIKYLILLPFKLSASAANYGLVFLASWRLGG